MLFKYLESFKPNEAVLRGDNEAGTELINPTNDIHENLSPVQSYIGLLTETGICIQIYIHIFT